MTLQINPRRGIQSVRVEACPEDVRAAIQRFEVTFTDFRQRNDRRFDGLAAEIDKQAKQIGRLTAGGAGTGDSPEAVRDRPQDIAAFFSAVTRKDVPAEQVSAEQLGEYPQAFRAYIRFGENPLPVEVRAAMQVGSDPDGGYWAPPTTSRDIKMRMFETTPMRQVASQITIATDSLKLPIDVNDAVTGGWIGETAPRPETETPKVGEQEIFVREQYANPKLTQKLLDMSSFPVESWLNNKIADKLARNENVGFVSGDGVSKPRGFLDYRTAATTEADANRAWGKLQYVPTGATGAFPTLSGIPGASDPDPLIDLQQALKPVYRANAVWMMNRATAGVVRKMKDGDGRLLWQDSLVQGQPPMLLGSAVVLAEDMPDIGSDIFAIAYGDFRSGYLIVDGPGIRVLRDPYTAKPYVHFYTTKWTGGDVIDFDAIKLLKFGTS